MVVDDTEPSWGGVAGHDEAQLDALLQYLYRNRGFDFHGYKRASLVRRIQKRMQLVGVTDFGGYLDTLEVDPEEFAQLFNTILINVTSFFRDGDVWQTLREHFEERIWRQRQRAEPVRLWNAGCASGEEAYTTAIVLAELMGVEGFCKTTKLYATDVDDDALRQARLATYSAKDVESMPPALLEKYFERVGAKYVVNKDLRRCVIFGRHNLIQDAPISRVDLLSCRNTLMYFNAETQAKILSRFHFALNDEGLLFLGKAEMLLIHRQHFAPLDLKRRIFAKVGRDRAPGGAPPGDQAGAPAVDHARLREGAFEAAAAAQIVLDVSGAVAFLNGRARALFGPRSPELGQPFREFEIANRSDVRLGVERAFDERRPTVLLGVDWGSGGVTLTFEIHVLPLFDADGSMMGAQICLFDVSQQRRLQHELQRATRELEATDEELQSTSEELETTNEELQSAVEELETTNEELQSTNEELETMNEELQSTNEELQTINEELRQSGEELNQANTFLSSILASLHVGAVVLDHDMVVRVWNHRAEDLWGLREEEVKGKHFLNLDIGLPVERLKNGIRACILGEVDYQDEVFEATSRRGKAIGCKVSCSPFAPPEGRAKGAILLMEEIAPSPNQSA